MDITHTQLAPLSPHSRFKLLTSLILQFIEFFGTGFEEQFGPQELEPTLWKAYFRAHAEYCTRCNICQDAMEQDRMLQAGRAPAATDITRPQDISSDEVRTHALYV